jgi:hypothetical protein
MILAVDLPGGTVFADPTTRAVPFGELPVSDQEAELLPVAKEGSGLVTTPATGPEVNAADSLFRLEVARDGIVKGSGTVTLRGDPAHELRRLVLETPKNELRGKLAGWIPLQHARVDRMKTSEPLELEIQTTQPIGSALGDRRHLRGSDLLRTVLPAFPAGPRSSPVVFRRRTQESVKLHLQLPKGAAIQTLPPKAEVRDRFGSYVAEWRGQGAELEFERSYQLRERIVAPEDYEAFQKFADQIQRAEALAALVSWP